MRGELGAICTEKCMVSALLYLQKSENQRNNKNSDQGIILTMYNLMNKIGERERKQSTLKGTIPFTGRDI